MTEKQDAWAKEYEKYRHTVDKLGKPIDEDIFETVVVLNILGVHSQSSCEGHLDHGHAYPWVEIALPDVLLLEKRASEKLHEARQSPDQYRVLMAEADSITNICKQRHQVYVPALFNYLERFYQARQIVYDRHLVLDNRLWTGRILLQSQGADYQEFSDLKEQKLNEYQSEMQAFTQFLKAAYFSQSSHCPYCKGLTVYSPICRPLPTCLDWISVPCSVERSSPLGSYGSTQPMCRRATIFSLILFFVPQLFDCSKIRHR